MADFVACPNCGSTDVKRVGYTWWGGALGPRLLNHVKCSNCGTAYNGKTGRSNTGAIIAYSVAIAVVVIAVIMLGG